MRIASLAFASSLLLGCSQSTAPRTELTPPTPPVVVEDSSKPAPVEVESSPAPSQGAAADGASKFLNWGAVHSLVNTPIRVARAISPSEAVALTTDNLVGVSTDGGSTWSFVRLTNGLANAVAGAQGGPFVAVGKNGFAAMSKDGKTWTDLPRYTNEELVAVAADNARGIVSITRSGLYVSYGADGKGLNANVFPDKAKPTTIDNVGGRFVALAGKMQYVSTDGNAWTAEPSVAVAAQKVFATSRGNCTLGRIDKTTGVVCEVKGQAYGTVAGTAVVPTKTAWLTTTNGGETWAVGNAPMAAANGIIQSGSNLIAYGASGAIFRSADQGKTWSSAMTELTKAYKTHWTDGSTVILAGDGGAIARSTDNGGSFTTVVGPQTGAIKQLAKLDDGRLVASLGAKGMESTDGGATWVDMADPAPLKTLPVPAKAGKCDGRQPEPGEICAYLRQVKSPAGLPNAKGLAFSGENGLAWGDAGLLLMTGDGGKNWKVASGLGKSLQTFAIGKDRVLGTSGRSVITSTDAGATFTVADLPKEAGTPYSAHVTSDGTMWVVGSNGTVLRGASGTWTMCDLGGVASGGKKVTTGISALFEAGSAGEAGGVVYAAGTRGELWRSADRGDRWEFVATGTPTPVQAVTAEGDTVVAVTYVDRNGGNLLLKSDDGGRHFYILREVSDSGTVAKFTLSGGKLTYNDRVSSDFGATWTRPADVAYWGGAVDVDGSGLLLYVNPSRYVRDTVYLATAAKDDWVIVDTTPTRMARFLCSKESGCWMLAGGQVYRPL